MRNRRLSVETKHQIADTAESCQPIAASANANSRPDLASLKELIKARIAETREEMNRSELEQKTYVDKFEVMNHLKDGKRRRSQAIKTSHRRRSTGTNKLSVITFDSKVASEFQENMNCNDEKDRKKGKGKSMEAHIQMDSLPIISPDMTEEELRTELTIRDPTADNTKKSKEWLLDKLKVGTICIKKARAEIGADAIDKLPRVSAAMTTGQLRDELLYRDPSKKHIVRSKWKEWFLYQLCEGSICISPLFQWRPLSPQESISNTVETVPTYASNSSQDTMTKLLMPMPNINDGHFELPNVNCKNVNTNFKSLEEAPSKRKDEEISALGNFMSRGSIYSGKGNRRRHSLSTLTPDKGQKLVDMREAKDGSKAVLSENRLVVGKEQCIENRNHLITEEKPFPDSKLRSGIRAKKKYFEAAKAARKISQLVDEDEPAQRQSMPNFDSKVGAKNHEERLEQTTNTRAYRLDATIFSDKKSAQWISKVKAARKSTRRSLGRARGGSDDACLMKLHSHSAVDKYKQNSNASTFR